MKSKILFLGAKKVGYECLKYILSIRRHLGIELVGVVPGTPRSQALNSGYNIYDLCNQYSIQVFNGIPTDIETDFIISVQYHKILTAQQIHQAKRLAINLHMAPLPEYRGANQFSFAIINKEREFGTTIHRMVASIDKGPIIFEKRFEINPKTVTVRELYDLTVEKSIELFKDSFPKVILMDFVEINQSEVRPERNRYFYNKKDIDTYKNIDLSWPVEKIDRYVRALDMPGFEPAYIECNDSRIYLKKYF